MNFIHSVCVRKLLLTYCLFAAHNLFAQDTTHHGWPVTPFFATHRITGVFSEFRNTGSSDHFHNGTDIPMPDGSPVYPVYNGTVASLSPTGTDAFVRVRYNVNGLIKSDAYVHINPNPLLQVGDSVYAYQTVLGNILTGQGHVHFTNGLVGSEINGIRPNGGLTPFIDNYKPGIQSVRFFIDGTNTEFQNNRVSGGVDIRVQIADTTAADPSGISSSTINNGTYIAGYKILSADRSTVVYEPPSAGVRFRFDTKPNDSYVGNVYAPGSDLSTHIYSVTNGDGADYINSTHVVSNNAWNTLNVPIGNYTAMVFSKDTRANADTAHVAIQVIRADIVPPAPPLLHSVINDSTNRLTVRWSANAELDLRGYRLYFSLDGVTWTLKDNESVLTPARTSASYANTSQIPIFFRLAAVDSAAPPNVSQFSDVYGLRMNSSSIKTLIVEGFDRTELSGSWHEPTHPFAMSHGRSLPFDFNTCTNEDVVEGRVSLQGYHVVDWLLGDESVTDTTFTPAEQALVMAYLRGGGKLFVSGSEIAYTLDGPGDPTQADRDFLHNFLKVRYSGDNANDFNVNGAAVAPFQGVSFRYGVVAEGSPYEEDLPDYVTPETGASVVLHYGSVGNPVYAGVGFKGMFSSGTQPGAVVYCGFPFETITTKTSRDTLMQRVYQYFDLLSDVKEEFTSGTPKEFRLEQNYPDPFNPSTIVNFKLSIVNWVTLKVYDVLGREVATLVNKELKPGEYETTFDATGLSSGTYIYKLNAGGHTSVKKMLLLR